MYAFFVFVVIQPNEFKVLSDQKIKSGCISRDEVLYLPCKWHVIWKSCIHYDHHWQQRNQYMHVLTNVFMYISCKSFTYNQDYHPSLRWDIQFKLTPLKLSANRDKKDISQFYSLFLKNPRLWTPIHQAAQTTCHLSAWFETGISVRDNFGKGQRVTYKTKGACIGTTCPQPVYPGPTPLFIVAAIIYVSSQKPTLLLKTISQ